ncbi:23S rRNA pseudouridylate synthase [Alishewanella agri BL06]|uniref:23S rRNA pseudouridylate synthase n=1 Tax=Alishewanella agri BL06 TaxID=1195246 RepID=I9DUF1_9ALTE|nr:pseudouridine synthase [Alishewanella agri]EIW89770.1 23S rRNA pseudouridylate synthase [Alishewanella agri BL06]
MLNAFSVIAETPQFWVLNKAAGLSFHSEQGPGLVALAEAQFAEKLYAVHRLDKVTSGLLILARQPAGAAALTQLFASRQITKCYLALSAAKPQKKQGWVKGAMQPARRGAWRLAEAGAAPAVTYFVSQGYQDAPFRAFLLRPYTGKTHQLRVALKSVGAPILGDSLYGGASADRVYLHACALSFSLFGQHYQYQCWPDHGAYFQQLFEMGLPTAWQNPISLPWPAAPALAVVDAEQDQ